MTRVFGVEDDGPEFEEVQRPFTGAALIRPRWEAADWALAAGVGGAALTLLGVVAHLWLQGFGFASSDLAARHLVAALGCGAAEQVGVAPAAIGQPGYWQDLDRDGDGRTCGPRDRG